MEENNITKNLGEIPDLVKHIKELCNLNAQALERRIAAEVSDASIRQVTEAVKDAVAHTECATPTTTEYCQSIADGVMDYIATQVKTSVQEAVQEATKKYPVRLERHLIVSTLSGMVSMSPDTIRGWFRAFITATITLLIILGTCAYAYTHSKLYFGREYYEVCMSQFITNEELGSLSKDYLPTGVLPKEFDKDPSLWREKIMRYKRIIKEREKEAAANNGHFSAKDKITR